MPRKAASINKDTLLCKCLSICWAGEEYRNTALNGSHTGTAEKHRILGHHKTYKKKNRSD